MLNDLFALDIAHVVETGFHNWHDLGLEFSMRRRVMIFSAIAGVLLSVAYLFFPHSKPCTFGLDRLTLSTVFAGKFVESIPFNARFNNDSASVELKGELDQLYFSRVSLGLTASMFKDGTEYSFVLTNKDSVFDNGRFHVTLSGPDSVLSQVYQKENLRMRLILSEVEIAVLLNVGGFYKDSGGKYVYVMLPDKKIVKRNVVLGKKNPECHQVLSGLVAGEVVITSSYENFAGRDDLNFAAVQDLVE